MGISALKEKQRQITRSKYRRRRGVYLLPPSSRCHSLTLYTKHRDVLLSALEPEHETEMPFLYTSHLHSWVSLFLASFLASSARKEEMRILMVGLDAAGKTTILFKN
jgi:hypothetical protein